MKSVACSPHWPTLKWLILMPSSVYRERPVVMRLSSSSVDIFQAQNKGPGPTLPGSLPAPSYISSLLRIYSIKYKLLLSSECGLNLPVKIANSCIITVDYHNSCKEDWDREKIAKVLGTSATSVGGNFPQLPLPRPPSPPLSPYTFPHSQATLLTVRTKIYFVFFLGLWMAHT